MRKENTRGRTMLGLMAGLALLAVAPAASAEISIPGMNFSPNANDESLKMLGTFFGGSGSTDLLQNGGGPMASAMSALMNIFNGAILSLASIFAFYTIVSAVVQTAHDGEVLGKRYSSLWVPIRSAAGIAAIVPAGGFSAVQILVLWIAAQGVGLANQLWSAGVGALASPTAFMQQTINIDDGEQIVRKLVPIAACMQANAEEIQKAINSGVPAGDLPRELPPRLVGGGNTTLKTYSWGFLHSSGAYSSCGSYSFDLDRGGPVQAAIVDAQNAAVNSILGALRSQIDALSDPRVDNVAVIHQLAADYNRSVAEAARTAQRAAASEAPAKFSREVQALADKGWSAAGGSFMALSKIAQSTVAPIDKKTFFVSPASEMAVGDYTTTGSRMAGITENVNKKLGSKDAGSTGDDGEGWIYKLLSPIGQFLRWVLGVDQGAIGNPILYWKSVGDGILNGVGIAVVAAMTMTYMAGAAGAQMAGKGMDLATGAVSGVQAVVRQGFLLLIFLIIGFATIGVTLAVYIPMLPYIIWISVLLSWLVAVAEAVIASPLWMMLHLNPEGDGVGAGTEAGYKFVAAIFLRPALSVISFFVACAVMFAIGGFVNATIREAYLATRADNGVAGFSISGIFTAIGYLFVMGGLAISIVSKSFNLCLTIPETILRWIGSSLTGGENLAGETKNEFGAAVGVVSHAGHQSLTPGMRGKGKKQVSDLDSDPVADKENKGTTTAGATTRPAAAQDLKEESGGH